MTLMTTVNIIYSYFKINFKNIPFHDHYYQYVQYYFGFYRDIIKYIIPRSKRPHPPGGKLIDQLLII